MAIGPDPDAGRRAGGPLMSRSDAPTVPVLTIEEVAHAWAGRGPAALCVGGFGNPREAPHDRVGLFSWPPDGGEAVLDVWVPTAGLDALTGALGDVVRRGGWDTMYATGWAVAWASGAGEARAWRSGEGPTLTLVAGRLWLRDGGMVEPAEVEAVEGWLSDDWIERGVRLRLRGGGTRAVLDAEEPAAAMGSFIYDGLDLLCDTSWIHDAGRTVAEALGVDYLNGLP